SGYEFEIDTIAMADDPVTCHLQVVTLPAMNTVSRLVFFFCQGNEYIILYDAVIAILNVYAEKIIVEIIPFNGDVIGIVHLNAGRIIECCLPRSLYPESLYRYAAGSYGKHFRVFPSVKYRCID